MRAQQPGEGLAGKLSALIGIEDFRSPIPANGLFYGLDTKIS
jgi:hypothetical protein